MLGAAKTIMIVMILIILFLLSKAQNHQILMKGFERSVS